MTRLRLKTPGYVVGRRLLFGRVGLYPTHLAITGWHWTGRQRRVIPLKQVARTEWWSDRAGGNFALHLHDGTQVTLVLHRGAARWKFEVDQACGRNALQHGMLPEERPTHTMRGNAA